MKVLPIEGSSSYHRDVNNHAVINTNNSEYESYMRQRKIVLDAKDEAETNKSIIANMVNDIESLKQLVTQLLNKDSNGTSSTS